MRSGFFVAKEDPTLRNSGTNVEFWGWKGEVDLGETKTANLQLLAFECKDSIDVIFTGHRRCRVWDCAIMIFS